MLEYRYLESLKTQHCGWALLRSDNVSFVASFLHEVFIADNRRRISRYALIEKLEDYMRMIREIAGEAQFPQTPAEYLNEWVNRQWLNKTYGKNDEIFHDLTSASERAIRWLAELDRGSFIATESRLVTMYGLLRSLCHETDPNPGVRIDELERQRDAISRTIEEIRKGDMPVLSDIAVKGKFQQFLGMARDLVSDFREIEQNFRTLDSNIRERILLGQEGKGAVLGNLLEQRSSILASEQGRSFDAFWKTLTSPNRQEEFSEYIARVLALEPVREMNPDRGIRGVYDVWLRAGRDIAAIMAEISEQLRRFVEEVSSDNRTVMDLVRGIERKFFAQRENVPKSDFADIEGISPAGEFLMNRSLYVPKVRRNIASKDLVEEDTSHVDIAAMFVPTVDKRKLRKNIESVLENRERAALGAVLREYPAENGLEEVVAYLMLAYEEFGYHDDGEESETVTWKRGNDAVRTASIPKVSFERKKTRPQGGRADG